MTQFLHVLRLVKISKREVVTFKSLQWPTFCIERLYMWCYVLHGRLKTLALVRVIEFFDNSKQAQWQVVI